MKESAKAIATVAAFSALLAAFTLASVLSPRRGFSEAENRVLADRPAFSVAALTDGSLMADYSRYLDDQFFFRDGWIRFKTAVERVCGKREIKGVYLADGGYLIESHAGIYTAGLADENRARLARFAQKYADALGEGHCFVLLAPTAVSVLAEKLPPFAPQSGEADFLSKAADGAGSAWIDAVSVLTAHRAEPLYYKTDHHWTTAAALYAAQAFCEQAGVPVPNAGDYEPMLAATDFLGTVQAKLGLRAEGDAITLWLPKTAESVDAEADGSPLAGLYDRAALSGRDKYAVFLGSNHGIVHIATGASTDRRLLIVKDSYANCFVPFLTRSFSRIDLADLRYTRRRLSDIAAEGGYTDILLLYNAAGFAGDEGLSALVR